jgi:hypothetical protein
VLTTCQPSTVWCSRERLPAAAAQPAKARQSCSATDYYILSVNMSHLTLLTIMFGSVAYLGSLSLKSALTTAGNFTFIVSKPPSTSLVTCSSSFSFSICFKKSEGKKTKLHDCNDNQENAYNTQ